VGNNNAWANRVVMRYFFWAFRHSFSAVTLSAALGFMIITLVFAFIIWAIGMFRPTCINGIDPDSNYFTDAFQLSWTTFATVVSNRRKRISSSISFVSLSLCFLTSVHSSFC
jgi:hypothetical protein